MKKVIYGALFLATVGIGVLSCQKEEIVPQVQEKAAEKEVKSDIFVNKSMVEDGIRRIFFDNGNQPGVDGVDYGCKGAGGNCLPDVIVKPSVHVVIEEISHADNSENVIAVVEEHYSVLNGIIAKKFLDGVLDSSLTLKVRGKISDDAMAYLIFKEKINKKIVSVSPVKLK